MEGFSPSTSNIHKVFENIHMHCKWSEEFAISCHSYSIFNLLHHTMAALAENGKERHQ
jgi:hypothetical protein